MADFSLDLESLERRLSQLLAELYDRESEQAWKEVETTSQYLANGLRVRDGPVDNHSVLGRTALPQSLTSLFTLALHGSATPSDSFTSVSFEILRVTANFCMDHDGNRSHLLEAGFPQILVSLLEGYAEAISPLPNMKILTLSLPHLRVIRTAIGVLLNASIGFDAVKYRLLSLEAAMTMLKLSTAIYPPGAWTTPSIYGDTPDLDTSEEAWEMRSGLSNWVWRAISELKDVKDETLQIFTPDVLPLLTPPLLVFSPPYPTKSDALFDIKLNLITGLLHTELEILEESCMLIESLSLDVEDIRLALARGLHFPAEHAGVPCFSTILDFIEHGAYPPLWSSSTLSDPERKRMEKVFDMCKAALIKSVVEVSGEDSNEDVLWDDSEEGQPGGSFVCRMVEWIKRYVAEMDAAVLEDGTQLESLNAREDMAICASLALGNLARREKNSTALLSPPHSLGPVLTSACLLSAAADIKVKHGVIGLLKHLAQASTQSTAINNALGNAGVVARVSESGIWDEKTDAMTEIVQLGAIGVVKHMCIADVEHTFALVLPSSHSPSYPTGLAQVLALVKRSDSVPIKSEGTRVLVNVVKSLWSTDPIASPTIDLEETGSGSGSKAILEKQRKRAAAIRAVLTSESALALATLVGRSGKYPLLVNEGVVALTLLSTHKDGGPLVLTAIISPLVPDMPSSPVEPTSETTSSDFGSSVASTPSDRLQIRLPVPRHALDMLIFTLKNVDNPANFPIEVRVNVCSFLVQLSKHTSGEELMKVKTTVQPVLEKLFKGLRGAQAKEEMLANAIKRVLDAWS